MSPASVEAIYAVEIFRDLTIAAIFFLFFFALTPFAVLHLKDSMTFVYVFS